MLTIIGYIAALTGALSLVPEVLKAYKTHHLQDVSWGMLWLMFFNSLLWGIYGIGTIDLPLVGSGMFNFLLTSTLIILKQQYEITGKPLFHLMKGKKQKLETALETETIPEVETEEKTQ